MFTLCPVHHGPQTIDKVNVRLLSVGYNDKTQTKPAMEVHCPQMTLWCGTRMILVIVQTGKMLTKPSYYGGYSVTINPLGGQGPGPTALERQGGQTRPRPPSPTGRSFLQRTLKVFTL